MDEDGKRMFGVLLLMFIVTLGITFENINLKSENAQTKEGYIRLLNERANCSPLGFCIGDRVEPTDYAKKLNISFSDAIVKAVVGNTLFIDIGNEEWRQLDEVWVKHNTSDKNTIKKEPETRWIKGEGESAPEEYQYYENYYKRSEEKVYQCEKLEGTNHSESDRCWFIGWR